MGGGIAGLLLAHKVLDFNPTVFDRRRIPGKKCTGVISYQTFTQLGISKEFIDREFKSIEIRYGDRYSIYINTNVIRLNREKLEIWLDGEVRTKRPNDAVIKGNTVIVGSERYDGLVIDCGGWKGNARWIKAIEYLAEPINEDKIIVYIDKRNVGGFSWIVPLPYGTLIGAISYKDPKLFLPKFNKRIIDVHGGAIPRVRPESKIVTLKLGDSTGLVKTFTGGGIFGIANLLGPLVSGIRNGSFKNYYAKYKTLAKEVRRQYYLTRFLETTWRLLPFIFKLYNERTINVAEEFDLHSLLIRRIPH
ncbi:NAD(P)/FAD-dependent oxidoreductase [Sulfolobus tengchongensis]|uniref:NAD(P)/FAD-dependent oxidoreductase n=1 Tax=Sulfolobus tengchongensis TaxID=207809 RepID=A0AAX4L212_9CREN